MDFYEITNVLFATAFLIYSGSLAILTLASFRKFARGRRNVSLILVIPYFLLSYYLRYGAQSLMVNASNGDYGRLLLDILDVCLLVYGVFRLSVIAQDWGPYIRIAFSIWFVIIIGSIFVGYGALPLVFGKNAGLFVVMAKIVTVCVISLIA